METHTSEATEKDKFPFTIFHHAELKKEVPCNLSAPFEIISKYRSQMKRLRSNESRQRDRLSSEMESNTSSVQVLSAASIFRIARMIKFQSNSQRIKISSLLTLSSENEMHLRRALSLLDAAEKFSCQGYEQAEKLLSPILSASRADHPVERVIMYFALDLQQRIDHEICHINEEKKAMHLDIEEAVVYLKTAIRKCEQKLPFTQITHFTGIQTILESVVSAERIHFIDVGVKLGSHWIIMMHALSTHKTCRLKQLKITAVCTDKDKTDETGKTLTYFAKSMNLPFSYKTVYSEINELKKDLFELEDGEVVAVYLELCLFSLSAASGSVESFIGDIKNLNPCLIVVSDVEAITRESTFIGKFYEALFICGSMFDSQDACLERDNQCRKIVEQLYYRLIIKNSVMDRNEDSFKKCLTVDSWREYFAKFGIVETDLSQLSMYQAKLMIGESACWACCTLDMNGKCMLLGWNGTPLRSISAWKFQDPKQRSISSEAIL